MLYSSHTCVAAQTSSQTETLFTGSGHNNSNNLMQSNYLTTNTVLVKLTLLSYLREVVMGIVRAGLYIDAIGFPAKAFLLQPVHKADFFIAHF